MTEKMVEETLAWAREKGIDAHEHTKIWEHMRTRYALTRYQASQLTLKVLDRME